MEAIAYSNMAKSRADSIEVSIFAYYIAFGLYIFAFNLQKTNFETFVFLSADALVDIIRITCVLILMIRMLTLRYTVTQFLGLLIVGIVAVLSLYVTKDWNLVLLFFFVAAGKGISLRRLAAIALPIQAAMFLLTMAFASFGVIDSYYMYRNVGGTPQLRSSMGYAHPNSFGQIILSICISCAILRFRKFSFADLILYSVGFFLCYFFADSKTSMICVALVAILSFAARIFTSSSAARRLAIISAIAAFGAVGFSFFMMVFYDSGVEWMRSLDSMLSARFSLAHSYFMDYPMKPFGYAGSTVTMYISSTYTQHGPDNAYVRMLLQDGILASLIFFALYFVTFIRLARMGRFDECAFGLLVFALSAVMESYALTFATNYCLIGTTMLVYGWGQYANANPVPSSLGNQNLKTALHRRFFVNRPLIDN